MKNIDLFLYLVTDSTYHDEENFLKVVEDACKSGITLLQLREKNKTTHEYLHLAQKVKHISDQYHIPLIIDDRIDIALAIDAAGVHLGSTDMPIKLARRLLGDDKIIGATAKTVPCAKQAETDGADYLGVGAIYPTTTKVITVPTPVSVLKKICSATNIPVAAIGGLNTDNIHILNQSGIHGIAVVSAVMKAPDTTKAVEVLKMRIKEILYA